MQERLMRLDATVHELGRFRQMYSSTDLRQNSHLEWALRYGLLEAIQTIIDISCHLAVQKNLGTPATYAECIQLLRQAGFLDDALANVATRMIGLRNLLVHEYSSVDTGRLYTLLDRLDDFRRFAEQVRLHI